jgi:hypothetical protein
MVRESPHPHPLPGDEGVASERHDRLREWPQTRSLSRLIGLGEQGDQLTDVGQIRSANGRIEEFLAAVAGQDICHQV